MPHGRASTLHAFALRQLNLLGDAWGRVVVTPWELRELVRKDLALGYEISFAGACPLGQVDAFLRKLGASFREDQDLPAELSNFEERLRQVFLQHRELFAYRLMDELAYDLARLIEVGTELPQPPSHVLVDEYQDLTAGELRLLQLLQDRLSSVINAAGDDRQSIFGFREADPRALHRFPEVYRVERPDYLWRSNRCPRRICDLANLIAAALPPLPGLERPDLEPWPGREDQGSIEAASYPSPKAEARGIVARCKNLTADGVRVRDIVVVVSAYYGPVFAALTEAANEAGMDGLFIDPRRGEPDVALEMRLAATCARLLANSTDQLAWRTLAWFVSGLGDTRLRRILEAPGATYANRLRDVADRDQVVARAVDAGDIILERFGTLEEVSVADMVEVAADVLGIGTTAEGMHQLAGVQAHPSEISQKVFELDEAIGEVEVEAEPEGVAVHTIFSAKGLEAPHLFVANAVNESFAGRGDPANGLRLAYVAITRSSSSLYLSGSRFVGYTALGNQMGVSTTRMADFLVDHCERLGIPIKVDR